MLDSKLYANYCLRQKAFGKRKKIEDFHARGGGGIPENASRGAEKESQTWPNSCCETGEEMGFYSRRSSRISSIHLFCPVASAAK